MAETIRLGLRLMLVTLIAGLCLAITHSVTSGPIRQAEQAIADAARLELFPEALAFEPIDLKTLDVQTKNALEICRAYGEGEVFLGYVASLSPMGYKASIPMTVGIGPEGLLLGVRIGDISETAGLGTKIREPEFIGQFLGISVEDVAGGVDTISGATISSKACKDAVLEAVALYNAIEKEGTP